MKAGLWLPIFGELAEPSVVAELAAEAEAAGWDGVFVWDHVRWCEPVTHVGDPWITCAAIACATERIRLGPMVTALSRRRPVKVARESAALDRLSGGRLVLGVGLGMDRFAQEFSMTGEQVDDRVRAQMLDESLAILQAAWSGEPVRHHGEHYTVDGMQFLPSPIQRPGIPVWSAGYAGKIKPMRRAARLAGYFPVNLAGPDQLAESVAAIEQLRPDAGPYDVVVGLEPGTDPEPYGKAGATWWLTDFDPATVDVEQVRAVLRAKP